MQVAQAMETEEWETSRAGGFLPKKLGNPSFVKICSNFKKSL